MSETRAELSAAAKDDLPDSAFAYIEPGGTKDSTGRTTPRSLRHFPHHGPDGAPDAPHVRNALARIPQSDVSDSAKASALAHVRAHAKALGIGDSDEEKAMPNDYETRWFSDFELREAQTVQADPDSGVPPQGGIYGTAGMPTLMGHAAKFGVLSEDLGGFREKISREAFRNTLANGDCRALVNHDSRLVLGRVSNGTLKLREDQQGLACEIQLPNTSYARDLVESIRRGDINGMSFGFRVKRDDWNQEGLETVRTLKDVELLDVSPVTYPAYPQTDVAMRSLRAFQSRAAEAVQVDRPDGAQDAARAGAIALLEARRRLLGQRAT